MSKIKIAEETIAGCIERIEEARKDLESAFAELRSGRVLAFPTARDGEEPPTPAEWKAKIEEHDASVEAVLKQVTEHDRRVEEFRGWRDSVVSFCTKVEAALGPIDVEEPLEIHDLRLLARDVANEAPDGIDIDPDDLGPELRSIARDVETWILP